MFQGILQSINKHNKEIYASIKLIDVEERFDLYFSRFFGLYLAKIGENLSLTPNQVTIASLIFGAIGGALLYFQEQWPIILIASFLITMAGLLDSADGQLARRTRQTSEFGRTMDGFIDNLVFLACYLGGCIYLFNAGYGWNAIIVGLITGFGAHSFSSNVYELYKTQYLFYVGHDQSSAVPSIATVKAQFDDAKGINKLIYFFEWDYRKKQAWLSGRGEQFDLKVQEFQENPGGLNLVADIYRSYFKDTLFWWAWIGGTNVHRSLMMGFSLIGRFDLYLIVVLIKSIPLIIMMIIQRKKDRLFLDNLRNIAGEKSLN